MSDKLYPISLRKLLTWILEEEKQGKLFGYYKELFFQPSNSDPFKMERYGQILETPIGVAAGPHTQLSHNIILAWLFGARYMELKTVQTLDEIEVAKPCIDMTDEGYNCEWSQELKIRQSFNEYLNAWIIIHLLQDKFGWDDSNGLGCIFNMSVGYDLKGIQNANVQEFFDLMDDCSELLNNKIESIAGLYPKIKDINIPNRITDNITLSTMHGCPPDEIEKIGKYLIEERNLHTAIKLNPTLLGPDLLRQILNEKLKFSDVIVPDEAFEHDLKYEDAIPLIKNLAHSAKQHKVDFGLKLTNTLEVLNTKQILPEKEATNYLSGRALHPISINLAAQLQKDFDGHLDISFSAGADAFNVANILSCNIKPVTTCTDVLKPGGFGRLRQYLTNITETFQQTGVTNIEEFITKSADKSSVIEAGLLNLINYADAVLENPAYQNNFNEFENIKTDRKLTEFDCIEAPCIGHCATNQQIPQYIYHTAQGEFDKALDVILDTNALPGITGAVCDQLCAVKCTRNNYDNPLLIRDIKRFATEHSASTKKSNQNTDLKIAIIGAGPAGLSAAYFLSIAGCKVEIFEAKDFSGGMVSSSIPKFRLNDNVYLNDLARIETLGIQFHYNTKIDKETFSRLQEEYDYVFIGTGAQKNKKLNICGENLENVIEPIKFLSNVKQNKKFTLGNNVAIIGGGNTAMDAARTAKRIVGETGKVTILYRRTRKEMPAEDAEIQAALDEGIELQELISPLKINGNGRVESLTCQRMKLGKTDESGRAKPVVIPNSDFEIKVDSIIPAIGQDVILDFIDIDDFKIDPITFKTNLANVYAGGDAVRGAATVVEAVGDGQEAAKNILADTKLSEQRYDKNVTDFEIQEKIIRRKYGIPVPKYSDNNGLNFDLIHRTMTEAEVIKEANRCLYCDEVCSMCVYVCPNLSNMSFKADQLNAIVQTVEQKNESIAISDIETKSFDQTTQIINIADFCNECGNCTTFCPTDGEPYRTKPHFFLSAESFLAEDEGYLLESEYLKYKANGQIEIMKIEDDHLLYSNEKLSAIFDRSNMRIKVLHSKVKDDYAWNSSSAVIMGYLLLNLPKEALFRTDA